MRNTVVQSSGNAASLRDGHLSEAPRLPLRPNILLLSPSGFVGTFHQR